MRPLRGFCWLAMLLSLAGCGTTPQSNYYILSSPISTLPTGSEPTLGIGPIFVPEYLNRNSMVYLAGDNELEIASYERWAEPIGDGIQRVLAVNLAAMLDTQNVSYFPWSRSHFPDYVVRLKIVGFDADSTRASLLAEWSLRRGTDQDAEITRRLSRMEIPIASGDSRGDAVAGAYSTLLHQLSEEIAAAIRAAMTPVQG